MKHLAAFMLLKLGGNDSPSKDDITKALSSVGIEVDDGSLSKLMADLEGKDLDELIALGKEKLMVGGSGGGGGGGAGPEVTETETETKQETAKEEEVDALDGGIDMFEGGDY